MWQIGENSCSEANSSHAPGISQVESDFSLVKGAKDVFKQSMTDLSLEGILHAKQMEMIKSYL